MARNRSLTGYSQLVHEEIIPPEDGIDIQEDVTYNQDTVSRIDVQLKFPARVIRRGLVTGEQYEWSDAGAVVSVAIEDVEQLLQLKIGEGACCGGSNNSNFLFEKYSGGKQ